jgi:hypothetical protein
MHKYRQHEFGLFGEKRQSKTCVAIPILTLPSTNGQFKGSKIIILLQGQFR